MTGPIIDRDAIIEKAARALKEQARATNAALFDAGYHEAELLAENRGLGYTLESHEGAWAVLREYIANQPIVLFEANRLIETMDGIEERRAAAVAEHEMADLEGVAEPRVSANSRSVANDPVAATPSQWAAAVLSSIADDLLAPIEALHWQFEGTLTKWSGETVLATICALDGQIWPCSTAQAVAAIREAVRA